MATQQKPELETARIPIFGGSTARGTSASKDQRFVNGYFEVLQNPTTKKLTYFFTKRPGLTSFSQPTGGSATARGMYSWRGSVFSCYGNKLYKGSTDLGVTLVGSSGFVSFEETRPSATSPVLAVSDGTSLYVIDTSDGVTVLNNKAITSSSIANPSVITAVGHGLSTGNKVIIRNHVGMIPDINGTVYTVTVTGVDTFTIPVNVTTGGTGGTIGVFPTPNLTLLTYFDGYLFVLKTNGSLHNCALDDPRDWDPIDFIVPIMDNGAVVGQCRQQNYILVFGDKWMQGYYNAANAVGSPLTNYEAAMLQIGCASKLTIVNEEAFVTWVGAADVGGLTVYRLSGTAQAKDIGDSTLNRLLLAEGSSISTARGRLIRTAGHIFYILSLTSANRTFVYDYDLDIWYEWAGTDGNGFPIIEFVQHSNTLLAQHTTDGRIYTMIPTTTQDNSVSFPHMARFGRLDFETNNRKFVRSIELLGDIQPATTPVLVQYSDDDYTTLSTARTFDMAELRPIGTNFGNFRRRSWQYSYTGASALRIEALQIKFRLGSD